MRDERHGLTRRAGLGSLAALAAAGFVGCGGSQSGGSRGNQLLIFGSLSDIFSFAVDTKVRRQLTKVPGGAFARDPAWSPDGSRIAYAYTPPPPPTPATRPPGGLPPLPVTDLYVMDVEGRDARVLVPHDAPAAGYESPVWAPDGRALYATYTALLMEGNVVKDQVMEVARVPAGGGPRQTLAPDAMSPSLSPDGKRLAFIASRPDGQALMVAGADGKNAQTLLPAGRMSGLAAPRYSPDGKQIVFSANAPAGPGPLPASPTTRTGATQPGQASQPAQPAPTRPAASPGTADGLAGRAYATARRLAARLGLGPGVAHAHGLPMDVFVVGADGGEIRRLTYLGEDNPAAAWSPDGRKLAIVAGGGLYLVNADGRDLTPLDPNGGHGTVDWQRA